MTRTGQKFATICALTETPAQPIMHKGALENKLSRGIMGATRAVASLEFAIMSLVFLAQDDEKSMRALVVRLLAVSFVVFDVILRTLIRYQIAWWSSDVKQEDRVRTEEIEIAQARQ